MALPIRLPNLGPRTRRVLRYVGIAFVALVVFVFALQMSFPYNRVKDKIIESLADKYDVQIGGVERGLMPGRVYFKAVTLRTRQTKPEEVVTTFFIKQIEVDAGILPLLSGKISVDIDAKIGIGTLSGNVTLSKFGAGDIAFNFNGENLPGDSLPMRGLLGLPMTGKIEFSVGMRMPMEKASKNAKPGINWKKVYGNVSLSCPSGCTFGDGKTKLKPLLKNTRNQAMVGEGIDFGKVSMESLLAKASIKNGTLKVDKFETKSKDGELHVDYMMALEKNFDDSVVTGCLRFKGSDDLLKREPKTFAALQTTGAELRGDGLFHIKLTDKFKDMKRLNLECGPNASGTGSEDFSHRNERPGLTVQPDEPAKPALTPPVPPPTDMETPGRMGSGSAGSAGSAMVTPPPPPAAATDGVPAQKEGATGAAPPPPPGARERPGEQGRIEHEDGSAGSANPPGGPLPPPPPPSD